MLPIINYLGEWESTTEAQNIKRALEKALLDQSKLPDEILKMQGMSGRKYRKFVNTLVGLTKNARYLETGSHAGSTACSAIYGNEVQMTNIDIWSEGSSKEEFVNNVKQWTNGKISINTIQEDFRSVDYASLPKHNIYLFDGPHAEQDQYDGVKVALPCLDDTFILIVDDCNSYHIRTGTQNAIKDCNLNVVCSVEILSSEDGSQPHPNCHGPSPQRQGCGILFWAKLTQFQPSHNT